MSYILGIDPGPAKSAIALYPLTPEEGIVCSSWGNESLLGYFRHGKVPFVVDPIPLQYCRIAVIEMITSYGMRAIGHEVFDTCVVIGELREALFQHIDIATLTRKEVVLHLCGTPRAGDQHVRQALIDRYGGKEKAIGTMKSGYGPLHGVVADMWSALAVAVTSADRLKFREEIP